MWRRCAVVLFVGILLFASVGIEFGNANSPSYQVREIFEVCTITKTNRNVNMMGLGVYGDNVAWIEEYSQDRQRKIELVICDIPSGAIKMTQTINSKKSCIPRQAGDYFIWQETREDRTQVLGFVGLSDENPSIEHLEIGTKIYTIDDGYIYFKRDASEDLACGIYKLGLGHPLNAAHLVVELDKNTEISYLTASNNNLSWRQISRTPEKTETTAYFYNFYFDTLYTFNKNVSNIILNDDFAYYRKDDQIIKIDSRDLKETSICSGRRNELIGLTGNDGSSILVASIFNTFKEKVPGEPWYGYTEQNDRLAIYNKETDDFRQILDPPGDASISLTPSCYTGEMICYMTREKVDDEVIGSLWLYDANTDEKWKIAESDSGRTSNHFLSDKYLLWIKSEATENGNIRKLMGCKH